jgi:putative ABC transport system permease protein
MTRSAAPRPRSRVRVADAVGTGTIGLRTRRGRTVLTALGVAVGIAALVATVGISASSRTELLDRLDRLGTNLLEVTPGQSLLGDDAVLPLEAPAMVRRIGPVTEASAVATVEAHVYRNDRVSRSETGGLGVRAVEPTLLRTLGATMHTGSFLDDATSRFPTVVLGASAARSLGIGDTDEAPQVHLGDRWFTVVGILDPVELVPSLDETVLIGLPVAQALFDHDGSASTIYVRTTPERVDAVRAVLAATASPASPTEVTVDRPSDALAARGLADRTLTALLLGLGAVALLVGGIGIANVMVIAVLERRTEIGVRRALGAARSHVLVQFLLEAAILAALGGVLGVAAGAAITAAYATSSGWRTDLPLTALLAGPAGALAVGAIAGLYPATRAARLAPADALRPHCCPAPGGLTNADPRADRRSPEPAARVPPELNHA